MTLGRSPVRLSPRVDWRMPLGSRVRQPVFVPDLSSKRESLTVCKESKEA